MLTISCKVSKSDFMRLKRNLSGGFYQNDGIWSHNSFLRDLLLGLDRAKKTININDVNGSWPKTAVYVNKALAFI